jgi:hypothetical protein
MPSVSSTKTSRFDLRLFFVTPFSNWSVPKLAEYCRSKGLLPEVTDEWVGTALVHQHVNNETLL